MTYALVCKSVKGGPQLLRRWGHQFQQKGEQAHVTKTVHKSVERESENACDYWYDHAITLYNMASYAIIDIFGLIILLGDSLHLQYTS